MSFISKLFRKKPSYIHPVFGTMGFSNIRSGQSYWEGHAYFAPTKTTIEVFVDGDESGVAAGTEEFYEEAQKRYQGLVIAFRPEINRQLSGLSKIRVPDDFDASYRLSSISVIDRKIRSDWTLFFDCLFDENFSVSIELDDWDHGIVTVDS